MAENAPVAVLNVGQNGQITVPAGFRKEHALGRGGKLVAVRMGDALVIAPHDPVLESICMRMEEAMRGAGSDVAKLKAQARVERAAMVRKRYGR
jgi:bifunctional DNA-binding transcriptional regulator/antitoxin component of YhaV-PrlF toxin-antitoxin module